MEIIVVPRIPAKQTVHEWVRDGVERMRLLGACKTKQNKTQPNKRPQEIPSVSEDIEQLVPLKHHFSRKCSSSHLRE